jgi:hypothetical protein
MKVVIFVFALALNNLLLIGQNTSCSLLALHNLVLNWIQLRLWNAWEIIHIRFTVVCRASKEVVISAPKIIVQYIVLG